MHSPGFESSVKLYDLKNASRETSLKSYGAIKSGGIIYVLVLSRTH